MSQYTEYESIKTARGTFRIKQNVWGNWHGYKGSKRVRAFALQGDPLSPQEWLALAAIEHTSDDHCDVDSETNCCIICGVEHGDACVECKGRGFHKSTCTELLAQSDDLVDTQRFAAEREIRLTRENRKSVTSSHQRSMMAAHIRHQRAIIRAAR